MLTKNNILFTLKKIKPQYESEGVSLLGLFGSYATNKQTDFSDIDILYHLDYYDKFSKKYSDGFSKLIRLNEIKKIWRVNLRQK